MRTRALAVVDGTERARVGLLAVLALTGLVAGCSRQGAEPLPYEDVVALVQSIAYEPYLLGDLLGHRVVLDLRPFAVAGSYYVEESHQISFLCRAQGDDFRGEVAVVARIVDLESSPSGVTTITLDSCSAEHRASQTTVAGAADLDR